LESIANSLFKKSQDGFVNLGHFVLCFRSSAVLDHLKVTGHFVTGDRHFVLGKVRRSYLPLRGEGGVDKMRFAPLGLGRASSY
jgi:hypothetical protein